MDDLVRDSHMFNLNIKYKISMTNCSCIKWKNCPFIIAAVCRGLHKIFRFICSLDLWLWKLICLAKNFMCPANITVSHTKLMYTAEKLACVGLKNHTHLPSEACNHTNLHPWEWYLHAPDTQACLKYWALICLFEVFGRALNPFCSMGPDLISFLPMPWFLPLQGYWSAAMILMVWSGHVLVFLENKFEQPVGYSVLRNDTKMQAYTYSQVPF